MRISELSQAAGVPVPTIKFYLREGLLQPGERTSATQAVYGPEHVERLGLVRALLGSARLSVEEARGVIDAVADPPGSLHDVLGVAQEVTAPKVRGAQEPAAARELVKDLGWEIDPASPELSALEEAIRALDAAGLTLAEGGLERYAQTLHRMAEGEVATVDAGSVATAVRQAVLGTVLLEPVILALRRLALQDVSSRTEAFRKR